MGSTTVNPGVSISNGACPGNSDTPAGKSNGRISPLLNKLLKLLPSECSVTTVLPSPGSSSSHGTSTSSSSITTPPGYGTAGPLPTSSTCLTHENEQNCLSGNYN